MSEKSNHNIQPPPKKWESLTWQDLESWAGSRSLSRGKAYHRQGRVKELARSADDRLLATVAGGQRYVVTVSLNVAKDSDAKLQSQCTCPVGDDGCKHAVAVVAKYLELLGDKKEVPLASDKDPRWDELENSAIDAESDEDEFDEGVEDDARPRRSQSTRKAGENWDEKIKKHIHAKSREELADLVEALVDRFPEIRDEFRERIALGEGDVDRLVTQARKELRQVTSQEAWRNHWNSKGNIPDYSKLLHRLERLLELGHADAVVGLGRDVIAFGIKQVERSRDEGETATELGRCLPVIFSAVAKSSHTPAQKLIFAIDAHLEDDYGIIDDSSDVVLDGKYQPSDWSAVADALEQRLSTVGSKHRSSDDDDEDDDDNDDFSRNYHRDQTSDWLVKALSNAGRDDEVLAVCEKEARITGSYERLVKHLLEQKLYDKAQKWATEGIGKTASKLPGIAANLATQLCELAQLREQWDIIAAHAAYQFLDRPSRQLFNELLTAADKAGCKESVQNLTQYFLESGNSPIRVDVGKKGNVRVQIAADWPLPMPEFLIPLLQQDRQLRRSIEPHFDVLIDIAIAAKCPKDILHWYDKISAGSKHPVYGSKWSGPAPCADRVAEAVAESNPQRSLEIYHQRVTQNLKQASVGAYETVASYLRKMKPIMKSIQREDSWGQMVEEIRMQYRNRPKFIEILDRLDGRTILSTQKARRR